MKTYFKVLLIKAVGNFYSEVVEKILGSINESFNGSHYVVLRVEDNAT